MDPSQLSVKQKKLKKKFDSANTIDEMLKAFTDLEKCFNEKDLGISCWNVAQKLFIEKKDSEKVIYFASRALAIMTDKQTSSSVLSFPTAGSLHLLGYAFCVLKRFDESLGYLNRAARILDNLDGDSSYPDNVVLNELSDVHFQLFIVKNTMDDNEESVVHLWKSLEIKEKMSGKDSREFAEANYNISSIYLTEEKFEKALPFHLKAMEIYKKIHGENSMEFVEYINQLGRIYFEVGELEKGLEQNKVSQKAFKKLGCSSQLLGAEIDCGMMLTSLGRYEEAVKILRRAVSKTDKLGQDRIAALTCLAEAFCKMENFAEAIECAKKVCVIVDKTAKSTVSLDSAVILGRIASVYKILGDFQTSLSLLKRIPPIVKKLSLELSSRSYLLGIPCRIGSLLVSVGKAEQAIPYLEEGVEAIKRAFSPKHLEVGYAYQKLAYAYLNSSKQQLAADTFSYAKDILEESLGPIHKDSITACMTLCNAYAKMGRYLPAISHVEETIKRQEALGPSAKDDLHKSIRTLAVLRATVKGDMSEVLSLASDKDALPLPLEDSSKYSPSIFAPKKAFGGQKGKGPSLKDESNKDVSVSLKGLKISKDDDMSGTSKLEN